eukprot:6559779-Prymnesium_polylepis.2
MSFAAFQGEAAHSSPATGGCSLDAAPATCASACDDGDKRLHRFWPLVAAGCKMVSRPPMKKMIQLLPEAKVANSEGDFGMASACFEAAYALSACASGLARERRQHGD